MLTADGLKEMIMSEVSVALYRKYYGVDGNRTRQEMSDLYHFVKHFLRNCHTVPKVVKMFHAISVQIPVLRQTYHMVRIMAAVHKDTREF